MNGQATSGSASSDTFFIEVAGPGQVALAGFELPPDRERYALSQQMIVLKLERLRAREQTIDRATLEQEVGNIAAEQRAVRANFVFLMGGEIEDEEAEAEHSHEIQEGRLENTATTRDRRRDPAHGKGRGWSRGDEHGGGAATGTGGRRGASARVRQESLHPAHAACPQPRRSFKTPDRRDFDGVGLAARATPTCSRGQRHRRQGAARPAAGARTVAEGRVDIAAGADDARRRGACDRSRFRGLAGSVKGLASTSRGWRN